MQCPLCLEENSKLYFQDNECLYQNCLECGLVFVPSRYFLAAEDEKARYDLHQNNPNDKGYHEFLMQLVRPMLDFIKPGEKGLDFGSGPESALSTLWHSYGFDIELFDPFYANDSQVLEQRYNFISATEVVEHLHHPAVVWAKLAGMLKPDGVLGIMTKTLPPKNEFSEWWYKNDPTHVCFYSEETFLWISERWKIQIEYSEEDVIVFIKG